MFTLRALSSTDSYAHRPPARGGGGGALDEVDPHGVDFGKNPVTKTSIDQGDLYNDAKTGICGDHSY